MVGFLAGDVRLNATSAGQAIAIAIAVAFAVACWLFCRGGKSAGGWSGCARNVFLVLTGR